ncbi:MAG TPA: hypothetical protein VLH38_05000 [Patescibacteria group bacterium]|nr:hypothetical protein [Patescibacteria group bacterium]
MKKNLVIIAIIVAVGITIAGFVIAFSNNGKKDNNNQVKNNANTTAPDGQPESPSNNVLVTTASSSQYGDYLTTASGYALYSYVGDKTGSNITNCIGNCATSWQPYLDTEPSGKIPGGLSAFKRTDTGTLQYAYKGLALYTFAGDQSGVVTGVGVGNFQLVKP